jgi:hypothetical protein
MVLGYPQRFRQMLRLSDLKLWQFAHLPLFKCDFENQVLPRAYFPGDHIYLLY